MAVIGPRVIGLLLFCLMTACGGTPPPTTEPGECFLVDSGFFDLPECVEE